MSLSTLSTRLFKHLQGWCLHPLPGQPLPVPNDPFCEKFFPDVQSDPPLAQLEAIPPCPVPCHLGEEASIHLSTTSFQVVVESNKVSPQPPLLQAKQPQFPHPLLISLVLQLCCTSLDTLQSLNVLLAAKGPELNTGFEVQPHQCRVQGQNHLPGPAGHASSDPSQDSTDLLGHLGHCWLMFSWLSIKFIGFWGVGGPLPKRNFIPLAFREESFSLFSKTPADSLAGAPHFLCHLPFQEEWLYLGAGARAAWVLCAASPGELCSWNSRKFWGVCEYVSFHQGVRFTCIWMDFDKKSERRCLSLKIISLLPLIM
ncbi:uncharacterized protein LOC128854090 [Cuculus canorus]|uniref:uncharacterized protein LOC128854090 n=1 Tax=Cuculus canorus TaxID=55661 RepID=UPI0023AB3ECA|nr:uncharacterized protein LOC128854090 [Cuculus canorus]